MKIKREILQWSVVPIFVIVMALGWWVPLLGLIVPFVMISGIIGGLINGRFFCGHLCPRGAFFDRIGVKISPNKRIPDSFKNLVFRVVLFVILISLLIYRLAQNPGNIMYWGRVFWFMCFATSILGIILAAFVNPRTWCAFCPSGTLQNIFSSGKTRIKIDQQNCVKCRLCEKACPMSLEIIGKDYLEDKDCLKCGECIKVCPKNVLEMCRGGS